VTQQLGPTPSVVSKKSPALLSHFNQQQLPLSHALPIQVQIQSMTKEQLGTLKKEIQEKIDAVGKISLKGLDKNKHFVTLGCIEAQLKLTSEQYKKPDAPKLS